MLRSVHHNGLHRVAAQVDVVLVRPAAFTFITSVSRLRAGFSLHFPVNGLSAAHTVPLARQIHSHTQIECLAIDSSTSTEFLWPSACTAKTTRRLVCILVRRSRTDDDFLSELELSAAHSHPACVACRVPQPEPDKTLDEVVLDSAMQIATPAFVSTLSICIVFAPMFLLSGVARYLFLPLAEAVVFAMLASYLLSRTIVPTMAKYLLRGQKIGDDGTASRHIFLRLQKKFESGFESFRNAYRGALERCLQHRLTFLLAFFAVCLGSLAIIIPWLGQDFFPSVDAGSFKLHLRGPTGTRIEDTAFLCDRVEDAIRRQIPAGEMESIIDNIGLPYSGINLSYSNSAPIGTSDADVMVTLSPKHHPTNDYVKQLRARLATEFPGVTIAFLPSDMVTQILNFGLPAPIDIQVIGSNLEGNRA